MKIFNSDDVPKIIEALENKKGLEIVALNVHGLTDITDTIILCTGYTQNHVKSLAENVLKMAATCKMRLFHKEGFQNFSWVVLDFFDMIVHIQLPDKRSFYSLDKMWGDAPKFVVENSEDITTITA